MSWSSSSIKTTLQDAQHCEGYVLEMGGSHVYHACPPGPAEAPPLKCFVNLLSASFQLIARCPSAATSCPDIVSHSRLYAACGEGIFSPFISTKVNGFASCKSPTLISFQKTTDEETTHVAFGHPFQLTNNSMNSRSLSCARDTGNI